MQGDTSLLIDATRAASKFLYRDYFELENLQQSTRNTVNFCEKSRSRSAEVLHGAISKYYKTIIISDVAVLNNMINSDFKGKIALIDPLEGIQNMQRALPFFAIVLTIINLEDQNITPEKVIINFPALGEIFYAEKGRGAWVQKHSSHASGDVRIRSSNCSEIANSMLLSSHDQIHNLDKIKYSHLRVFDSFAYSTAMLASGKVDICLFSESIISNGMELIVQESGGRSFTNNNLFIGSNFQLSDKIKHLYEIK
jgi:myo-inositol-1(or 4)-monophosphatase